MTLHSMSDIIDKYLQYIKLELNLSRHTQVAYSNDLRQWQAFLTEGGTELDVASVTTSDIRAWMLHLSNEGDGARTLRRKLQAVRALYKWLMIDGQVTQNPAAEVEMAHIPKRLPQMVRESSVDAAIDEAIDETSFDEVRNRLIVMMLYETGMRRDELIGLLDHNVDTAKGELRVHGKRDKDRIIPFGTELAQCIDSYRALRERTAACGDRFFIRSNGEPLYPMLVYRVVRRRLGEAGVTSKRSPHVLRHTFATAMLNNGASLGSVKELLGHESLATTQIYTHVTFSELKKIINSPTPGHLKKEANMEIKVKAIHFDATEKLEQFINKKVEKLVKHHEEITNAEVTLKVVKPETAMNKEASIKLFIPRSEDLLPAKLPTPLRRPSTWQ